MCILKKIAIKKIFFFIFTIDEKKSKVSLLYARSSGSNYPKIKKILPFNTKETLSLS